MKRRRLRLGVPTAPLAEQSPDADERGPKPKLRTPPAVSADPVHEDGAR